METLALDDSIATSTVLERWRGRNRRSTGHERRVCGESTGAVMVQDLDPAEHGDVDATIEHLPHVAWRVDLANLLRFSSDPP